MKAVLYARLSVSKEESVSIDRQLESARKYAEGRGWEVVGEFVDDGVSATANRPEDRKGWSALLLAADFQAVVIWKIDRLARKVLDFLQVDQVLQARGAGLVAVEDPIDMTTPMGRAFATILAVFGEMEAAAIASRVKAARAFLIKDGRWPGGGIPYGYQPQPNPDGPGQVLGIDPDRIDWLKQILARAQAGETMNAIASWLTAEGAPLPAGRVRKSGSTAWARQAVARICVNAANAGARPHNPGRPKSAKRADPFAVLRDDDGEPVLNPDLAVITWAEFTELVQLIAERSAAVPQGRKAGDRQGTSPLLSKVARCDDCDRFMCRATNQQRPVLVCPVCRQTLSRRVFDPWLTGRLLTERGDQPYQGRTVAEHWRHAFDDREKRHILISQVEQLRVRRGVVGRYFDEDRILLTWKPAADEGAS